MSLVVNQRYPSDKQPMNSLINFTHPHVKSQPSGPPKVDISIKYTIEYIIVVWYPELANCAEGCIILCSDMGSRAQWFFLLKVQRKKGRGFKFLEILFLGKK